MVGKNQEELKVSRHLCIYYNESIDCNTSINSLKNLLKLNNVTNQYDNVDGMALHTIMGANGVVLGTINFENQK